MRVIIGNDHVGLELKNKLDQYFKLRDIEIVHLGTFSEEGNIKGLSLLDFEIKKLRNKKNNNKYKIPNIGWRSVEKNINSILLDEIENDDFYFVHSFAAHSANKNIIISKTNYCEEFISIVGDRNIFGVQFHPEKSDKAGLKLLKNFIEK